MLKQVKRNKRLKWIDSRYAKPYRIDRAIYLSHAAQIVAMGIARYKAILYSSHNSGKSVALADSLIKTHRSINSIPKPKGRVSLEPPPMNNHKE